jgi:hypothetical protein
MQSSKYRMGGSSQRSRSVAVFGFMRLLTKVRPLVLFRSLSRSNVATTCRFIDKWRCGDKEKWYESEGFARIVPLQQVCANDFVNSVCTSKYYRLHDVANSAFRDMVPSMLSWAGGSESSEPLNPFADWVEFILIDIFAQISVPGLDRRTHGSENRLWLDHCWFSRYRPGRYKQGSRVALQHRVRHRCLITQILGRWGDPSAATS